MILVYSVKYILVAELGIKGFSVGFIIQIIFKNNIWPLNNAQVGSFRNKHTILVITLALLSVITSNCVMCLSYIHSSGIINLYLLKRHDFSSGVSGGWRRNSCILYKTSHVWRLSDCLWLHIDTYTYRHANAHQLFTAWLDFSTMFDKTQPG